MPQSSWEAQRLATAIKCAKVRAGAGWSILSPFLREALVAREVLSVLQSCAAIEDTPQGRLATLACQYSGEN